MENKKKYQYQRVTITFDCGSKELKEMAIKVAKNFEPVSISLSDLCQIALKKYIAEAKNEKI